MTNFPGDDVPDAAYERLTAAMDGGGGHGETRREEKKDERWEGDGNIGS